MEVQPKDVVTQPCLKIAAVIVGRELLQRKRLKWETLEASDRRVGPRRSPAAGRQVSASCELTVQMVPEQRRRGVCGLLGMNDGLPDGREGGGGEK